MLMLGRVIPDESEAAPSGTSCGRCGDCRHYRWCDCIDKEYMTNHTGADWDSLEDVGMCASYDMLTVESYVPDGDDCFEP